MASPMLYVVLFAAVSSSLFPITSPSPTETAAAPYAPSPSPIAHSSPELVQFICNLTSVYEFCMEALGSDPRTASAPDIRSMAKIALDLAVTNATNVRNYIGCMLNRKDLKPAALKSALEKCGSWYESVFYSFRSALVEVGEDDAMTANYDALVAGDFIHDCEWELSSRGVSDPSISAKGQVMMHFVRIGDTVTDLLWPS